MVNKMDDFKLICVTNRKLCKGYEKYGFDAFYDRISEIVNMKQDIRPASIILREKDLSEEEYREVAKRLKIICDKITKINDENMLIKKYQKQIPETLEC